MTLDPPALDAKALDTAAQVDELACALFGADFRRDFAAAPGVAQVVAVTPDSDRMHVIAIGADAPRSEFDFFVLNLVRAWAEVVFVGAEVLRSEPGLSYDLADAAGWAPTARALAAWRAELGIVPARRLVVLSRSGDVPLDHPVWSSVTAGEIHTGPAGRERLGSAARDAGLELWASESPGLPGSIAHLQGRGVARLSVEAGPGAAAALYADGVSPDSLLRSVYDGPLVPAALGPRFAAMDALAAEFERRAQTRPHPDAHWRFEWWTRRASSG